MSSEIGPEPSKTQGETPVTATGRNPYAQVLRLRNFRRLWFAMTVSSLGDWIGLYALITITDRLAPGNPLAIGGLMTFRVLPALFVGPLAGVALDRWDKRKAMIVSDVLRAGLILLAVVAHSLPVLYAVSFFLETIALVWTPAKDALIPTIVPARWLVAVNSLALFSTYGAFPLGALIYAGLVGLAGILGNIPSLQIFKFQPENLALYIDSASFLVSSLIVSRIAIPAIPRTVRPFKFGFIFEEMGEGIRYLRDRGEVARMFRGIAVALSGGAVIFSLGTPYVKEILGGGTKGVSLVTAALGTGMGLGVLMLGFLGDRLPKVWVFALSILGGGVSLVAMSAVSGIKMAIALAGLLGAFAGMATANIFAILQERVEEKLRGRTFASVQIVIRLSLFVSLVAFPVLASAATKLLGSAADGTRLAIAFGGLIGVISGTLTAWDVARGRIK